MVIQFTDTLPTDVIPLPHADIPSSISMFNSPEERQGARRSLDLLNKEVEKGHGRSTLVSNVERDLKKMLTSDQVTHL